MSFTIHTWRSMQDKEVKIVIERVLTAATVFRQGGSFRLVLPKKAAAFLKIERNTIDEDLSSPTVILLATTKGILMRSLEEHLKDKDMRD
jgi:hypothetical protein